MSDYAHASLGMLSERSQICSTKKEDGMLITKCNIYWQPAVLWTVLSMSLLIEVVLFNGFILNWMLSQVMESWSEYMLTINIEIALLVIAVINALYSLANAFHLSAVSPYTNYQLKQNEKSNSRIMVRPSPKKLSVSSPVNERKLSSQFLSPLCLDSPASYRSYASSASFVTSNDQYEQSKSIMDASSYSDRISSQNLSEISRNSSYSKPMSSIQTSKQLDKFIADSESSMNNDSRCNLLPNNSLGYSPAQRSFIPMKYNFIDNENYVYNLGTPLNSDEDGNKDGNNKNDRIAVTSSRVSFSPISMNTSNLKLLNDECLMNNAQTNPNLMSHSFSNNDLDESISFRVAVNTQAKQQQSPKRTSRSSSPLSRRSESCERHRLSSISSAESPSSESHQQSSSNSNSPLNKQITFISSEIMNQYKLTNDRLLNAEHKIRSWICQTIVRPLVKNITSFNELLNKKYQNLHLKIGRSSVESLQSALSSKGDLIGTVLPYLIPYLKVHEKQAYIVKRASELSLDMFMKEFKWQSGGSEPNGKSSEGSSSYAPAGMPWGEYLPTDSQLIWYWLCTYLDARMETNPMAANLNAPFSSVYFLNKFDKPSTLQSHKDAFYVHQTSINPPHFELVVDGGRERFDVGKGSKNLWRTILLFLQHIRLFNNNHIDHLSIGQNGINLSCVLDD